MAKPVAWAPSAQAEAELELRRRGWYDRPTGPQPMVQYQRDPIGWMVEQMGVPRHVLHWSLNDGYAGHTWDGDPDPFVQMAEGLAYYDENGCRAVSCESGTTTGKTVFIALICLWFNACFPRSIVVTVAPKEDQLRYHVWKQITHFWPAFQKLFPGAKKDTLRIQMVPGSDDWGAIGFVAGVRADEVSASATKAQGFHAQHMLVIYEEMPGIAHAVREAFKNTCRAPHNLQIGVGNPDNQYDALHRLAEAPGTIPIRISALDHPNIVTGNDEFIPGAVSAIGLKTALAEVRGDTENAMYKSRVRGISPSESKESLIKRAWLDKAVALAESWAPRLAERAEDPKAQQWPSSMGVDPSNSRAGDMAAWCRFVGPVCVELHADPCQDANALARELWPIAVATKTAPEHIGVDPIGVGAGTVNEFRRLVKESGSIAYVPQLESGGNPWDRVAKPGEAPGWVTDANRFQNLRAQMYWQLSLDLLDGKIGLPYDVELFEELLAVKYRTDGGKTIMLPKDKVKETIGRSPNKADAIVYANFVRPRTTPIDRGESMPDDRSLGFKRVNGVMRPISAQDRQQPDRAAPVRRPGIVPYWKR